MTEVLQANIFFLIASIATVVFCIMVSLALYQVVKILQSVRTIIDRLNDQSEQIVEDIDAVRTFVRRGSILQAIISIFASATRAKRNARNESDDEAV